MAFGDSPDNKEMITQFQRACRDLNINLISAHSPQAKGRAKRGDIWILDFSNVVRAVGIEPTTFPMWTERSSTELSARKI